MAYIDEFNCLADELRQHHHPLSSQPEITAYPSGAVDLVVRVDTRTFEIVYVPSQALFCVDELEADAGFDSGYRYGFQDFESAKAKLLCLLDEARAASTPAAAAPPSKAT